ncbi:4Fe-4S dicluster domain-containing protein [Parafilimonas sp.]|uniref:4Fe-4S dicluster domain-containing protein n=1 Tax=Parafilimonas sp. TaxID=1969739 RepID=UPI0039E63FD4
MHIVLQLIFIAVAAVTIVLFVKKISQVRRNILLGRDEAINDNKPQRWKNVLLLAFGQKKMFRNPLVAVMHFIIYAGFIIINLEVLEIIIDGIFGTHRIFAKPLGNLYPWLINAFEFLAVGVFTVCVIFLIRRNILHVKRLWMKELNGWPKSDANYILITEILLMSFFLTMNAADTTLQIRNYGEYAGHSTGNFALSQFLQPLLAGMSNHALMLLERTCWWLHIVGIFVFLNYLPYSKHLHILFAFPNAYYGRLSPKGKMENMPDIQQEVLYAMQPELAPAAASPNHKKFGSKDIFDLSWKNLLDAYSCTECGRCTAACPANITGKVLSPRLIMMKTRDRAEDIGRNINQNKTFANDNKSLLHDYITTEELRACTTCQACVEECPVSINPLDIIIQLRRYLVMEESNAPQEWNAMFSNMENNFAPWKFSPDDRDRWTEAGS